MKIHYAVQINTENTTVPDNTSYGFVGGVFRFITSATGYPGTAPYPKNEDTSDNTYKWFSNWLLKNGMTDPMRKIDISESGDYGTISSFNFKIRNDLLLWKWIATEGIYLTNRKVDLFIVLDDVFYPIWSGVISNNPYDETDYEFVCVDLFQKVHKMIPPKVVDKTMFPDSKSDVQGDAIPVTFGDVKYSKLQTVSNDSVPQILAYNSLFDYKPVEVLATAATEYISSTETDPDTGVVTNITQLSLYTPGKEFIEDELKNMYVFVATGGGDPDTDIMNKIVANNPTSDDTTLLTLESPFEYIDETTFNWKYAYDPLNGTGFTIKRSLSTVDLGGFISIVCPEWQTFENINCNNNRMGCNEIVVGVASITSGTIDVFIDSQYGDKIGSIAIPATGTVNKVRGFTISLNRRLTNANQTLVFHFYNGLGRDKKGNDVTGFHYFYPTHNKSNKDTWWFSVVKMNSVHILSNNNVADIYKEGGNIQLYRWNTTTKTMDNVSNLVIDYKENTTSVSRYPQLELYNSNITKDGSIRYLVPLVTTAWKVAIPDGRSYIRYGIDKKEHSYWDEKRNDTNSLADKSNYTAVVVYCQNRNTYEIDVNLAFPMEYVKEEFDKIYFGLDFSIRKQDALAPASRFFIHLDCYDTYGNIVIMDDPDEERDNTREPVYKDKIVYPLDASKTIAPEYDIMMLPNEYYKGSENLVPGLEPNMWSATAVDDSDPDNVETKPFKNMMELPSDLIDKIRAGTATNTIRLRLTVTSDIAETQKLNITCSLRQAGFVGVKSVSAISDDFYVRLKGETDGGAETNTVYRTFKHILENYDGIPSDMINYNNLPITRSNWPSGRQLTDRKLSFEYLKELASHSFVGIYPDRTGRRCLKSWRDDTVLKATFDETTIVRDSIQDWQKTKVVDLYNEFKLWYDFNPATGKFDASLSISNVDKNYYVDPITGITGAYGFPVPTIITGYEDSLYEAWKDYAGGINANSYADAKPLWLSANESWNRSSAIQPVPDRLSKLYWYSNTNDFNNLENKGASTSDSAYKFLTNLVEWTTRQKDVVSFQIPVSTTNIVRELLDYINFSDAIYTDDTTRPGWITGVKFNIKKDTIGIEATLEPENQIIQNIIDERGQLYTTSQHDESGDRDEQVNDGQNR